MSNEEQVEFYGKDAAEWLRRWDDGCSVWSIEMGGLGPGYEQCIQIVCAECVRHMLASDYSAADFTDERWRITAEDLSAMGRKNETIKKLGLSGSQWGAGVNLAMRLFNKGPVGIMNDERVKDRHIQVQRTFPIAT